MAGFPDFRRGGILGPEKCTERGVMRSWTALMKQLSESKPKYSSSIRKTSGTLMRPACFLYAARPHYILTAHARSQEREKENDTAFLHQLRWVTKMPLMITGNAHRPRAFKKKTGQELGINYWSNKKAWMNTSLFFDWLKRFSMFIANSHNRKVVLLLDNGSAHGNVETIPPLTNVEIVFLPPNTTAKLQPMDAGVIAYLKRGYRKWQYEMAVDNLNATLTNIYKVDQLVAMKVVKAVWQELSSLTVHNCWTATGLLTTPNETRDSTIHSEDDVNSLIEKLVPARSRMSLSGNLNCESTDCFETDDIETLSETVVQNIGLRETNVDSGEESEDDLPLPSLRERRRCIDVTMRLISQEEEPNFAALRCVRRLRGNIRSLETRRANLTTVNSLFSKQ